MATRTTVELVTTHPGDNPGPVVDLELEPQWKSATLQVRCPEAFAPWLTAKLSARSWDDNRWSDLASVLVMPDGREHSLTANLDPGKELFRWTLHATGGTAEVYCKLTLSDEESVNE